MGKKQKQVSPDDTALGTEALDAMAFDENDSTALGMSLDPLSDEAALNEFLTPEDDGVTAPSEVDFERREEVIKDIRGAIENLIKAKWDSFEYSRLLDASNLNSRPTLAEIKRALIPYVRKGWYVTVAFTSPNNENILLTYEANGEFLTSSKYGRRDNQERTFIRLYPKTPETIPYMTNIVDGGKFFGIPAVIGIIAATAICSWLFSPFVVIGGVVLTCAAAAIGIQFSGEYFTLKRKSKANKKIGPLLWMDDIQGYRTSHKTVTRDERIKQVVKTRVLAHEDD